MTSYQSHRIPNGFVILKITETAEEAEIIAGLLRSRGIESRIISEGVAPIAGMGVAPPIPQHAIFVNRKLLRASQKIIGTAKEEKEDPEFSNYKKVTKKKRMFWRQIVALFGAIFMYLLSLLSKLSFIVKP